MTMHNYLPPEQLEQWQDEREWAEWHQERVYQSVLEYVRPYHRGL